MMKEKPSEKIEKARVCSGPMASDRTFGNNGLFRLRLKSGEKMTIIASDGGGWDHVSVSVSDRCPTWDEMCIVKNLFFDDSETVVQYHPRKELYIDLHPFTLHLWKKQGEQFELPPIIFV